MACRGHDKAVFYKEYENGCITVYPSILVIRYTTEQGAERVFIFRYNLLDTDINGGGFIVDGPNDILYIYTEHGDKKIKSIIITPHNVEGVDE